MESTLFNNFKYRFLSGDVNPGNLYFTPVNVNFATNEDAKYNLASHLNYSDFLNNIAEYSVSANLYAKTLYKNEISIDEVKPLYVNSANSASYLSNYNSDSKEYLKLNRYLKDYNGFYILKDVTNLKWFSNRVNGYDSNSNSIIDDYNNKIVGIMTDGFNNITLNNSWIPIGYSQTRPFNGILDGMNGIISRSNNYWETSYDPWISSGI